MAAAFGGVTTKAAPSDQQHHPPKRKSSGKVAAATDFQAAEISSVAATAMQQDNCCRDYASLAREYLSTQVYRDLQLSAPAVDCVVCRRRPAGLVLFPCSHRSVCGACWQDQPAGEKMCAVCGTAVKRAIPYADGREAQRYWAWVEEVKPPLPPGFACEFKAAAVILQMKAEGTYVDDPPRKPCCIVT
ncbi:unnamed protein product [Phaeothamnion confervicola]